MSQTIKVTWTIEFRNCGGVMPGADDEEFSDFLVEVLMENAPNIGSVIYGDDEEPADLEPIGWALDAGEYGDMQVGTLIEETP